MSTFIADGWAPSPGMVMMLPVLATTNPAPAEGRIVGERVLGLGDADRGLPQPGGLQGGNLLRRLGIHVHTLGSIDLPGHRLDLLGEPPVVRVEWLEVRLAGLQDLPYRVGQIQAPLATAAPGVGLHGPHDQRG